MRVRKIITFLMSAVMLLTSAGIVSASAEDNTDTGAVVDIASCSVSNGTLTYELNADDISAYDIYTAVYSSDGAIIGVKKNETNGAITGADDASAVKVFVWEKDTMKPVCEAIEENVYSAYVFAYFRKLGRDEEKLCLGVSRDGYAFRTLNGGEPVFQSSREHTPGIQFEGSFRDPQIMRGEDGKFYVAVTDLAGTSAPNHQITIYPTKDLINFEQGIVVDYSRYAGFEDTNRAWAPQIIWCPDHDNGDGTKGAYMIYLAIERRSSKAEYGTCMYKQFTTDLYDVSKYTAPEYMLAGEPENGASDYPTGAIDGDIVYDKFEDRYIMYYDGQNVAVSDTIDGIYTFTGQQVFGGRAVEGSNIFKLNGEDKWIMCADGGSFGTGFNMTETTDFKNYTTLYRKSDSNPNGYDYDFTPRHGYVVPITERELTALMGEYGYVNLPNRNDTDNPLADMTIPYTEAGYKIAGNITLPKEYDGHTITWKSSDEKTINTTEKEFSAEDKAKYGENYTTIPAGQVTRPENGKSDKVVTLTATAVKDGKTYTKSFVVKVKEAPQKNYKKMDSDGDFKGYLYASFIEPAVTAQYQQVYFALSDDGRNWEDLNHNKPVLTSTMGTKATRDHYILRSPEGDRFYLIATDLDCTSGNWGDFADRGSKSIMVWESDDLVNWSDQRMVQVADLDGTTSTGCVWAPEAIYDELTGEYVMYWSGTDLNEGSESKGKKVVYYSKTRDFRTFTPQKQFVYPIESDGQTPADSELATSRCFIDTTMIQGSDGLFYRTTKYEETSPLHVFVDAAQYPLGEFKRVKTNLQERDFQGTEGPGWFKYNKDDAENFNTKYCLMLDGYGSPNRGVGFFPNSIPDLNNTWESIENGTAQLTFTRIKENYKMRSYAKHGGIVPLTQEEYDRVNEAYNQPIVYSDSKPVSVSSYDFEQEKLSDINASFTNGASLADDAEKGKVLYLDGTANSYMQFAAPRDTNGKVLERYTVSFDIKNNTTGNYFNFYIGDGSSNKTAVNYFGAKIGDSILLSSKDGKTEQKQTFNLSGVQGKWKHCDIVVADSVAQIYIDKELIGECGIFSMEVSNANVIRFGFSPWSADNASNAYYDNIYVYPEALSADGLKQEDVPNYLTDENILFYANNYWTGTNNDVSRLSDEAKWTSEQMPTFDGSNIHYIGVYPNKPVTMGEGYSKNGAWVAMEFNLTNWAHGDYAVKDIDGNYIFADCYASDAYWIGHGERSFGGNVKDNYGVNRFENYLKTVVTAESEAENTGKIAYGTDTLCTILVENKNGAVDGTSHTTGEYYTVKVFKDGKLVTTEYYSGKVNGIKTIENKGTDRNCFGNLKFYGVGAETVTESTPDTAHMLFGMNFNSRSTRAYKGNAVANGDISYERVENGNYAAVFDGTSAYLSLKNDNGDAVLKGKDNVIITMKAKAQQPSTTNGWYFYTSWNDAAQGNGSGGKRSYMGLLESGRNIKGERYRDSNSEPTVDGASKLGEWQEITYVISGNKSELYIDGVFCAEADYPVPLSTILGDGNTQVAYVGKANWGSGEYYKGVLDNIEIYDFAPALSFENLDNLKSDLELPTPTVENDGYSITWQSSNEDVISNTGEVKRPDSGRAEVTLTATITFGGHTITKNINATVRGNDYYEMKLNITGEPDVEIQDNMYGLFFEDINYGADGGLYAEMIENRSFEQMTTNANKGTGDYTANPSYAWSSDGTMEYKTEGGLNENNPTYLEFTGTSFANQAYQGMYIENGKRYKVSFWAKSDSYTGSVAVNAGTAFDDVVASTITNEWTKYEAEITATSNARNVPFTVELQAEDTVDFDMISVIPSDAVDGVFRKDLAEKLKDINPGFLRFPGGCVIEGYNLADRYQWKNSIGTVEERKQNWNRWAADTGYVNYNQTYGIGFYEYFKLCEYLECDPLPVLSVGIPCEYQGGKGGYAVPIYNGTEYTAEFQEYIDDALDLIEFANGGADTEWGAKRVEMGHEEPFNLTMIGIGNEQWRIGDNDWYERYEAFEKEIHAVYPEIKLIGTSGPSADGALFDEAWSWIREKQAQNDKFTYAVDEHYYMSPEWFLENDHRYDHYDRGTKVFAGEYAAHTTLTGEATKKNNLESAISEAAFMTGLERNADVVYMASYAPLLARIGYTQWQPDLIWFDDAESYCSPNYYVQKMYASNNGTYTLKTGVINDEKVYQTVSYDAKTGDVIVKIANPDEFEHKTAITLDNSFTLSGTAEEQLLTGNNWTDSNSIDEPDKIAAATKEIDFTNGGDYIVPAKAFVVLRIHTDNKAYVALTEFSNKDSKLTYKLTTGKDYDDALHDVSVEISDTDGNSVDTLTELSGSVDIDDSKEYEIKIMVYDKDTTDLAEGFTPITKTTMDNSAYKIASYTTNGAEYHGVEQPIIGNSLHLAVSTDGGKSYEPLNSNVGVLFAEADYTAEGGNPYRGVSKMLRSPYLFKMPDGSYGVITARADGALDADSTDGKAMIYTSDDLTEFEFVGYLELDSEAIYEPMCKYENGAYTISWSNEKGGARKSATTNDFQAVNSVSSTNELYTPPTASTPYLTKTTNVLNLTKSEYDKLTQNLNAPVDTEIKPFEDVAVNVGENVTLPRATAIYNDGSTQEYNVVWNMSELNTAVSGTYTVHGTIETKDYPTNFIPNRADPCMLKHNGKYYFVATRDADGQTVLNIRVADTIDGIASAEDNELLSGTDLIWAPEIHNVDGRLMIFFATGRAWNYVQSHVMVLNDGGNPTTASDWAAPVRITKQDGTNLIENGITLDMTAFEWNNKWYYAWSHRITDTRAESGTDYGFASADIYIAEFNPSDPTKLTSDISVIAKPVYGWERTTAEVDEGPFTIVNDGKLYMTIATNGTNTSYGIKLLTLKENGNPLEAEDWITKGYPILATAMNTAEPGPGHSSFTIDENGDPVLVYHWGRSGSGRTTTVKNVHFNAKGEPVLNIQRGEQVKNKDVSIRVTVN